MPNVVGKTEAEAKADLEAEDLGYNVTSAYSDSVEKGRIISQNPVEKNFVDKGTTITITVSLGKETTVYKYDTGTLTAPNDGKTYTGGKFRLCDPAGNLLWGSDEFTGTSNSATISNIKNIKSGTLYVDWYYTQEDGTKGTNTVTYAVEFKEQS